MPQTALVLNLSGMCLSHAVNQLPPGGGGLGDGINGVGGGKGGKGDHGGSGGVSGGWGGDAGEGGGDCGGEEGKGGCVSLRSRSWGWEWRAVLWACAKLNTSGASNGGIPVEAVWRRGRGGCGGGGRKPACGP